MERSGIPSGAKIAPEVFNRMLEGANNQPQERGGSIVQFKKGTNTEFTFTTRNGRIFKFFARLLNVFSKADLYDKYGIGNTARQQNTAEEFHQLLDKLTGPASQTPRAKLTVSYLQQFYPVFVAQPQSFREDVAEREFDFNPEHLTADSFSDDSDNTVAREIKGSPASLDDDDADDIPDAVIDYKDLADELHNESPRDYGKPQLVGGYVNTRASRSQQNVDSPKNDDFPQLFHGYATNRDYQLQRDNDSPKDYGKPQLVGGYVNTRASRSQQNVDSPKNDDFPQLSHGYVTNRDYQLQRDEDSPKDDGKPQSFREDVAEREFDFNPKHLTAESFSDDSDNTVASNIKGTPASLYDDADDIPDAVVDHKDFADESHNESLAKSNEPDTTENLPVPDDKAKK